MEHPETFEQYWYHNQVDHRQVNGLIYQFLENHSNRYDKLIFSDEFISTLTKKSLEKLKSDFEARGYGIRIISYIREPFNLLVSSVQQRSKVHNIERILRTIKTRETVNKIRRLKKLFGCSAEFYCFERTCQHENGPVGFFFDLLQIKLDARNTLIINEGMSNQASRLSSFINRKIPLYNSGRQINPGRRRSDLDQIHKITGDKFGLTLKESESIIPKINKARSDISDQLGKEFLPECEVAFIPEQVIWKEKQIDDLIGMSASLDLHILSLVYKYLLRLDNRSAVDCPDKLAKFFKTARERLQNEGVKDIHTIIERIKSFVSIRNRKNDKTH